MARLEDLRPPFSPLSWGDKVVFMQEYITKRTHDLTAIIEFNLKVKEKKVKEPKEKKVSTKTVKKKLDLSERTPEELELLKKLGVL